MVYVANSGRDFNGNAGDHNVAIFSVRADGGLTPFGDPVPTGMGARSLKFRSDGRFAYVVAFEENRVYSYAVGQHGGLTALSRTDVGDVQPFGLAVAPNGRSLYTANIGGDDEVGTISAFRIDHHGVPMLIGKAVPTGFPDARNVIVSRDGKFLFVSHGFPDDPEPDSLVTFPILSSGGLGHPLPAIEVGGGGTGMVFTPDGRFLYIACSGTNNVFGFRYSSSGTLTPVSGSPVDAPRTPEGLSISGGRLYVTSVASQPVSNPTQAGVWTFTIGANGALTAVGPRVGSFLGPGIATTKDHLYTGDFFAHPATVSAFDITSGPPRELADSPYPSRGLGPGFDAVAVRRG